MNCKRVLLLLALLAQPSQALATEPLVLNSLAPGPYSTEQGDGLLDQVVREAFNRIGRDVVIGLLPSKRGIALANSGLQDGHYPRLARIVNSHDNLRFPAVPLFRSSYVAVTWRDDIDITNWESLRAYSVAYPQGTLYFKERERFFGSAVAVATYDSLLEILLHHRVDVALMTAEVYVEGAYPQLRIVGPKLGYEDNYLMLNKKHEHLIPVLESALRSLTVDGTLEKLCPPCAQSLTAAAPDH